MYEMAFESAPRIFAKRFAAIIGSDKWAPKMRKKWSNYSNLTL